MGRTILKRIKLAKRHKIFTNCFGTSLYIVGILNKDRFVSRVWDYEPEIEKLARLDKPELGSLVIFRKGTGKGRYIDHMALVLSVNPTRVIQRELDGHSIGEKNIERVIRDYDILETEYRRPSIPFR